MYPHMSFAGYITNYVYALQDPDATDFNIITCDSELDGQHNSLAASFNVAPNTIDFSSVWSQFANLDSNPVVFSVVIGTLCVYTALLVWSTRKDRQDKIKVSSLNICKVYLADFDIP